MIAIVLIINNPNLENSFDFKLNYNKSARFNCYWLPHPLSSLYESIHEKNIVIEFPRTRVH